MSDVGVREWEGSEVSLRVMGRCGFVDTDQACDQGVWVKAFGSAALRLWKVVWHSCMIIGIMRYCR